MQLQLMMSKFKGNFTQRRKEAQRRKGGSNTSGAPEEFDPPLRLCASLRLCVKFPLNFDIINCNCIQTLQQVHHFSMVELRIIRLDREKESIARGQGKV